MWNRKEKNLIQDYTSSGAHIRSLTWRHTRSPPNTSQKKTNLISPINFRFLNRFLLINAASFGSFMSASWLLFSFFASDIAGNKSCESKGEIIVRWRNIRLKNRSACAAPARPGLRLLGRLKHPLLHTPAPLTPNDTAANYTRDYTCKRWSTFIRERM